MYRLSINMYRPSLTCTGWVLTYIKQEAHGPWHSAWEPTRPFRSFRSSTYTFYVRGVEIELIFTLWAGVSEIWVDFQNCHIWVWNLAPGKASRSGIHIIMLSFYPRGRIELIFALRAVVSWTFFKMAIFSHETWPLAKIPEVAWVIVREV